MPNSLRLGDFILAEMESILVDWESFAATIIPTLMMDSKTLRDHAEMMLRAIAQDLSEHQSQEEQENKSKSLGPRNDDKTAAEEHAEGRLAAGFTIEQMFSEYRALRASVLHLWAQDSNEVLKTDSRDITRFNEAIDQAIAESLARYSTLLKGSQALFLAILGHDLRNPLSTMIMASSALMRADVGEKSTLVATKMFNTSQRMTKLVEDLIDYTRTQLGGKLPITLSQENLSKICAEAVEEQRIAHPHKTILINEEGSFDSMLDKNRIAQVFSNILGNAIQHGTSVSPIVVTLKSFQDSVSIAVANHGKPIPAAKIEQIFEPLVRFSEDENRDYSHDTSLGIGLYIAREIVLAHQGMINVTSSVSEGTVFKISLPRQPKLNVKESTWQARERLTGKVINATDCHANRIGSANDGHEPGSC